MIQPVLLGSPPAATDLAELTSRAHTLADDVPAALRLAVEIGVTATAPGTGGTLGRWQLLASLGAADLTCARVVEPHLDALAILAEAAAAGFSVDLDAIHASPASTWGVFASEGPGGGVTATPTATGWRLDGTKPWCSLAGRLSHALITANTPAGRGLFAIALQDNDIHIEPSRWVARGLVEVSSGPIELRRVPAVAVGAGGWYLDRSGFAWGGIGVAAVWLGGAVALARALYEKGAGRADDVLTLMQLGAVDAALTAASGQLAGSAATIDAGTADGEAAALLAARVRAVVAEAAELTLIRVGHALGPAPLALDAEHARRVADLQLYLRQQHAERDQVALGSLLVKRGALPW